MLVWCVKGPRGGDGGGIWLPETHGQAGDFLIAEKAVVVTLGFTPSSVKKAVVGVDGAPPPPDAPPYATACVANDAAHAGSGCVGGGLIP